MVQQSIFLDQTEKRVCLAPAMPTLNVSTAVSFYISWAGPRLYDPSHTIPTRTVSSLSPDKFDVTHTPYNVGSCEISCEIGFFIPWWAWATQSKRRWLLGSISCRHNARWQHLSRMKNVLFWLIKKQFSGRSNAAGYHQIKWRHLRLMEPYWFDKHDTNLTLLAGLNRRQQL